MKVLLIAAATSTTGGGERHVADLMRHLPPAGVDIELLCPTDGDLTALAHELDVQVYHADIDSSFSFDALLAVRSALRHSNPDLIHAHGSRARSSRDSRIPRRGSASSIPSMVFTWTRQVRVSGRQSCWL